MEWYWYDDVIEGAWYTLDKSSYSHTMAPLGSVRPHRCIAVFIKGTSGLMKRLSHLNRYSSCIGRGVCVGGSQSIPRGESGLTKVIEGLKGGIYGIMESAWHIIRYAPCLKGGLSSLIKDVLDPISSISDIVLVISGIPKYIYKCMRYISFHCIGLTWLINGVSGTISGLYVYILPHLWYIGPHWRSTHLTGFDSK